MTNLDTFFANQLNARYAGIEPGNYALECADVEELRNYPAVDGALPAYHRSLGDGYVIFEGFVDGSHIVVFQAAEIDRDRAGRDDRFIGKHGLAGYVSDTLKAVCEHIGDTDVCERAVDSYVYVHGLNWYTANPDVLVVDRPAAAASKAAVQPQPLERVRRERVEAARATLTQMDEDVEDSFCPAWMNEELAETWSDYETHGDL